MTLPKTLTVAEAALATGLSEKAIRRRIDRETLRTVNSGGRVHVYVADLLAAGVPVDGVEGQPQDIDPAGKPHTSPTGARGDLVDLVREMVERAIVAETNAARAQALLEANTTTARQDQEALGAAQGEVYRMAARVKELEAQLEAASSVEVTPEAPPRAAASWWQRMLGSA